MELLNTLYNLMGLVFVLGTIISMGLSLTMHATGQSGHAYHPHYIDMAYPWRLIQYHPMLWDRPQVEAAASEHLRLAPQG